MTNDGKPEHPDLCITLVHGTWARGFFARKETGRETRWFDPTSAFVAKLTSALDHARLTYKISPPFLWSGANSIIERQSEAHRLADELRMQSEQFPNSKQLLIAHSHGGNVALLAADTVYNRPNGSAAPGLFVATIATPFIRIINRDKPSRLSTYGFMLVGALVPYLIQTWRIELIGLFGYPAGSLAAFITVLAAYSIWTFLIVALGIIFSRRPSATELVKASTYKCIKPPLQLLVVRGFDDEAAAVLLLGALSARLNNIFGYTFMGAATLAGVVSFLVHFGLGVPDEWALRQDVIDTVLLIIAIWVVFLAFFMRISMSVYGRELFICFDEVGVLANSTPDVCGKVHVVTLNGGGRAGFWMAHKLYENEHCARAISDWLCLAVDPKKEN